jgi:hypothetical protein
MDSDIRADSGAVQHGSPGASRDADSRSGTYVCRPDIGSAVYQLAGVNRTAVLAFRGQTAKVGCAAPAISNGSIDSAAISRRAGQGSFRAVRYIFQCTRRMKIRRVFVFCGERGSVSRTRVDKIRTRLIIFMRFDCDPAAGHRPALRNLRSKQSPASLFSNLELCRADSKLFFHARISLPRKKVVLRRCSH